MTDKVPGMAEAIDKRAGQLGLTPGKFAEAAGLTLPGLRPVREGVRKDYAPKTRIGVAVALQWPRDWYDRLEAGEDPDGFPEQAQHVADLMSEGSLLLTAIQELTEVVRQLRADLREGRR